jgi:hypothetical protein
VSVSRRSQNNTMAGEREPRDNRKRQRAVTARAIAPGVLPRIFYCIDSICLLKYIYGEMAEQDWETIKKEIDDYILTYFAKIEWYYGENRAPFAYPVLYRTEKTKPDSRIYVCELVMEDPGAENIIIKEDSPGKLFTAVKETINRTFTSFESDNE